MPEDEPQQSQWDAEGPSGSTPLEPGEVAGLVPAWVATRADLNEAEQQSILDGLTRRRWRLITIEELLDDLTARALHKDMFGDVWAWAGSYRSTERSIGVDPRTISVCVRDLMEDAKLWVAGTRPMSADEAGYRFHHRLVSIHPFPNGSGRHGRAMTDILLRCIGAPPFSWGIANLDTSSATRGAYIAALRAADAGDFARLADFVRS